jgi:hypothetical protein
MPGGLLPMSWIASLRRHARPGAVSPVRKWRVGGSVSPQESGGGRRLLGCHRSASLRRETRFHGVSGSGQTSAGQSEETGIPCARNAKPARGPAYRRIRRAGPGRAPCREVSSAPRRRRQGKRLGGEAGSRAEPLPGRSVPPGPQAEWGSRTRRLRRAESAGPGTAVTRWPAHGEDRGGGRRRAPGRSPPGRRGRLRRAAALRVPSRPLAGKARAAGHPAGIRGRGRRVPPHAPPRAAPAARPSPAGPYRSPPGGAPAAVRADGVRARRFTGRSVSPAGAAADPP